MVVLNILKGIFLYPAPSRARRLRTKPAKRLNKLCRLAELTALQP